MSAAKLDLRAEAERIVSWFNLKPENMNAPYEAFVDQVEAALVSARQDGLRQAEAIARERVDSWTDEGATARQRWHGLGATVFDARAEEAEIIAAAIAAEAAKERKG